MTVITTAGDFEVFENTSPRDQADRLEILRNLNFGREFTDHMVRVSWDSKHGWTDRRVEPYGPLTLDPAAAVLPGAFRSWPSSKRSVTAQATARAA